MNFVRFKNCDGKNFAINRNSIQYFIEDEDGLKIVFEDGSFVIVDVDFEKFFSRCNEELVMFQDL